MGIYNTELLKARLNGGAKTDKFGVIFKNPKGAPELGFTDDDYCLILGYPFPGRKLGSIPVWTQGRKLMLPGDTEFDNTWRVNLYNTLNHDKRQDFINWMNKIDNYKDNTHADTPWDLVSEAIVFQLNGKGEKTAQYLIKNIFPTEVGNIEVKGSEQNQIQTYDVTFTVSSMEVI